MSYLYQLKLSCSRIVVEQSGTYLIPAARNVVWDALNDEKILAACIDGCESMTRTSESTFDVTMQAKIGPMKARFHASAEMSDVIPLNGYTLNVSLRGSAGFGSGAAEVHLSDEQSGTRLTFNAKGNVGGKLAQIGSRLIQSVGKKMADAFFSKFAQQWDDQPVREKGDIS